MENCCKVGIDRAGMYLRLCPYDIYCISGKEERLRVFLYSETVQGRHALSPTTAIIPTLHLVN